MQRGSRSWRGETGGALPAEAWKPRPLEEGQTTEALSRLQPCPSFHVPPALAQTLTCDVQQLQLPVLASQEQRPRVAGAGWRQQPGQQGCRGEAVVPFQHGHQGETLIHQIERELADQEEMRLRCGKHLLSLRMSVNLLRDQPCSLLHLRLPSPTQEALPEWAASSHPDGHNWEKGSRHIEAHLAFTSLPLTHHTLEPMLETHLLNTLGP